MLDTGAGVVAAGADGVVLVVLFVELFVFGVLFAAPAPGCRQGALGASQSENGLECGGG